MCFARDVRVALRVVPPRPRPGSTRRKGTGDGVPVGQITCLPSRNTPARKIKQTARVRKRTKLRNCISSPCRSPAPGQPMSAPINEKEPPFAPATKDVENAYEHPPSDKERDSQSLEESEYDLKLVDPTTPGWVPDLTWTPEEEAAIRKYIDWHLLPIIFFKFLFLNLDRFNISNALTGGIMKDIGATLDTMNLGATLLLVGFCVFEIPSNMVIMRVGAHRWLPFLMVCWGLVSTFQVPDVWQMFITDTTSFLITRFLIGAFEAGWIPGVVLYFSFHYKRGELATRLAVFWSCNQVSAAISGVLAYGILQMNGIAGLKGWQWLFALEGGATVLVGIASFWLVPDSPCYNKALTERQRQIAVTRLIRDDPHKGGSARAHVSLAEVWAAVGDWNVWPNLLFAFIVMLINSGYGFYLPLIIQSFGFSALNSNLLTIPGQIVALILGLGSGFISDRLRIKWQVILFGLGGLLLGYILNICIPATRSQAGAYVASIITVGFFLPWHSVNASWQAANVAPAGKRAIVFSMYIISVNIAGALGVWLYRDDDRPYFRRALSVSIVLVAVAAGIVILRRLQLQWLNKLRQGKWEKLSGEERDEYIKTDSRKLGDRALNYRYIW
ncbi:major facilitator superfamily domain-containing protein [Hyaloraphidium curvatum]|nr:major facilitator superfamily domain-containing protein [Hyaloraphidium curvatum]